MSKDNQERFKQESLFPIPTLDQKSKLMGGNREISGNEIMFMGRQFVQATLPHSDPKTDQFVRVNGNVSMCIQSEKRHNGELIGLPYGVHPKVLLGYATTYAVRHKTRHVEIHQSFPNFLRSLGFNPAGHGPRSPRATTLSQAEKLFSARVSFEPVSNDGRIERAFMDITSAYQFFGHGEKNNDAPANIMLGKEFYETVIAHPIPIDFAVMRELIKHGALCLDLYMLLAYEVYRANESGKERKIPYRSLAQQMGQEYGDVNNFARKVRSAIKIILKYFPIKVEAPRGAILVRKGSHPSVPKVLADI